jgi:hypothetical protein
MNEELSSKHLPSIEGSQFGSDIVMNEEQPSKYRSSIE